MKFIQRLRSSRVVLEVRLVDVSFLPTLPSLLTAPNTPLIHRDLSWLQFNERVLNEAKLTGNPLLERAKFLAITASNLDEFFMIRVPSLARSIAAAAKLSPEAVARSKALRDSVLETVAKFAGKQAEALEELGSELEKAGIRLCRTIREGEPGYALSRRLFEQEILPRLVPPEEFQYAKLSSLENLQTAAIHRTSQGASPGGEVLFRIPRGLPAVLWGREESGEGEVFLFFLDELLGAHLGPAFRLERGLGFVRLTRDGDFTVDLLEEDTTSLPDAVRTSLGTRDKGRPTRLQYWGDLSESFLGQCLAALKCSPAQIIPAPGTLCLHGLWSAVNQALPKASENPALGHPPLYSGIQKPFRETSKIFERLAHEDLLLHHPYDSFDAYVGWIRAACADPDVALIEQTVYRMDALSPVIEELKGAAARGKKVRVVIELRARFDELNNLRLADELRKAGVEVAFGFGKLKMHAKIALVSRREGDGLRLYTHLSTGNYNAATARQYTDLAILTANPEIGADARVFFDAVWKGEVPHAFQQLVSAPARLHRRLLNLIHAETEAAKQGRKARIIAKVNALVDDAVVDQLYAASRAGVQVDLIVRGACSLVPGLKGLSENIRVVSIVDRFLEHSRVYYFQDSRSMYLSSADWMPRNFFSRLELAFPVMDPHLYQYLEQIVLPLYLSDTVKGRELTPLGTWKKRTASGARGAQTPVLARLIKGKPVRSQFVLEELAAAGYVGTPLENKPKRRQTESAGEGKPHGKQAAREDTHPDPSRSS